MLFDCGCDFSHDDAWDAYCPLHDAPIKLGTISYEDLTWAHRELSKHGVFSVDEIEEWI